MNYDIFLSYRRTDQAVARELVEKLEQAGLNVWWDHKIEGGVDWRDAIVENLTNSTMLVILFSEECNDSRQLRKELALADELEKDVVPILIDSSKPKGHFLYELASRNWLIAEPQPLKKIPQMTTELVKLVAKAKAGDDLAPPPEGSRPSRSEEKKTQKSEAPQSDVSVKDARKALKAAKKRKYRDFLPYRISDFVLMLIATIGLISTTGMATNQNDPNDLIVGVTFFFLLLLLAWGAVVFPIRYFLRNRPALHALKMYLLSSLTMFAIILGAVTLFVQQGLISERDADWDGTIRFIGGIWLAASAAAFVIYFALSSVRALWTFRRNSKKL